MSYLQLIIRKCAKEIIHPKYGTIWSTNQDWGRRFGSTLAAPVSLLEWLTQKANDRYKDHLDVQVTRLESTLIFISFDDGFPFYDTLFLLFWKVSSFEIGRLSQEAGRLHVLKNRWWKQRRGGGKCDVSSYHGFIVIIIIIILNWQEGKNFKMWKMRKKWNDIVGKCFIHLQLIFVV